MVNQVLRTLSALTAVVAVMCLAGPAQAALVSISGGTQVNSIPQGNSGNTVLGQAGITVAGGEVWVDGTLDNLGEVKLTLYQVGGESHWNNRIRLANTSGPKLNDTDNFWRENDGGVFTNGPAPFELIGSVTQNSGVANFEFWRNIPTPAYKIVVNGQSPMMMVPDYGYASIALAYLNDNY